MSFKEKIAWIMAVIPVGVYIAYLTIILGRTENTSLTEVSYKSTMLWAMGVWMAAAIAAHVVVAIASPREADKKDQRDREIYRFGEYIGQFFLNIGGVVALGMSLAELNHFWIANSIYLAFVLSSLLGSVAKILAYRRGFQQW